MLTAHIRELWITQKTANKIQIETKSASISESALCTTIQTDIAITNLCLNERNIIISNGRCIVVYKLTIDSLSQNNSNNVKNNHSSESITNSSTATAMSINSLYLNLNIKLINTFIVNECTQLFIYEESIVVLGQLDIKIYSLGGVILKELHFNDIEGIVLYNFLFFFINQYNLSTGRPIGANLTNKYLTIFSINGIVKIFDISHLEPKLITQPKYGHDLFSNFGEIIMAKCNINGTFIAITIANKMLIPDGKIYIWSIEHDSVLEYNPMPK